MRRSFMVREAVGDDVRIMLALAAATALGSAGLDVDQLASDLEYI